MGIRQEDRTKKMDSILFLYIGRLLQEELNRQNESRDASLDEPISNSGLNKGMATIIRHWETLRLTEPEYILIHKWGIRHTAYRYGQILYTQPDRYQSDIEPDYLENVVKRSPLLCTNVQILNDHDNDIFTQRVAKYYKFPWIDIKSAYSNHYDLLHADDIYLANLLPKIFGGTNINLLNILATMPTREDFLKAINAEIIVWLGDMSRLFTYTKEKSIPNSARRKLLNTTIDAFLTADQIVKKDLAYRNDFNRAIASVKRGNGNISNSVLNPILKLELRSTGIDEERRYNYLRVADIMTGFLGLWVDNVSGHDGLDIWNELTPKMRSIFDKKIEFLLRLSPSIISQQALRELESCTGNGNRDLPYLTEYFFEPHLEKIRRYLHINGFPSQYDINQLFDYARYQSFFPLS